MQPTGAFKVRGGINLALSLGADEREAGLVTASTGNHAQSVSYGARLVGSRAVIVVPESAPPGKIAAVRALGGEVVVHGPTMDEAVAEAKRLAGERGLRYVDPGNEPAIVHGHATVYLELLQRHPELEAIYVPVGSGTGASGACVVREVLAPDCRVVAVQSSSAPAAHDAWRTGRPAQVPCRTRSSGLATGMSYALPQRVLSGRLDDFVLVADQDLDDAAGLLASHAHTLAETAGAAALAGLLAADEPAATRRRRRDRRQRDRGRDPRGGGSCWRRDHPPLNGPAAVPDRARECRSGLEGAQRAGGGRELGGVEDLGARVVLPVERGRRA